MGDWIKLKADDGHELGAYVATPAQEAVGALVVVQEIFGVNKSIREVADTYAREGFLAIAPALFDRFEPNVDLGYGEADMKRAFGYFYPELDPNVSLLDIAAAFHHVKRAGKHLRMQPDCCVAYYPGGIGKFASEEPVCPVMLHIGLADDHIGKDQVDAVRTAHPEVELFLYEGAEHAFANRDRPSYHAAAAELADQRSLAFLNANLA